MTTTAGRLRTDQILDTLDRYTDDRGTAATWDDIVLHLLNLDDEATTALYGNAGDRFVLGDTGEIIAYDPAAARWSVAGNVARRHYHPTDLDVPAGVFNHTPAYRDALDQHRRHGWWGAPIVVHDRVATANHPEVVAGGTHLAAAQAARLDHVPAISTNEICLWHGTATLDVVLHTERYPATARDVALALARYLPAPVLRYFRMDRASLDARL